MRKPKFLAISILISAFVVIGFTAIRNDWLTHTHNDTIEDYEDDILFFYDKRSKLCFSRDSYDGKMSLAPCEDVKSQVNPKLSWVSDGLWFFKDLQRGICMAGGSGRHVDNRIPVPCRKIEHLLGPTQGRYRIDKRINR